jgi:hypothetical protein
MKIATFADVQAQLKTLDLDLPSMQANAAYLAGDHFQKSNAWGGPAIPADLFGAAETLAALEKDIVPIPVISEIADHYVTGLVGNEPSFSVQLNRELTEGEKATPEEEKDIALLNDALTSFYDTAGVQEPLHEFATRLLSGRATLRACLPPRVAQQINQNVRRFADLNEAASAFFVEAPDWDKAGVLVDAESRERVGAYLYAREEKSLTTDDLLARSKTEITFIQDATRKTVFRVIEDGAALSDAAKADTRPIQETMLEGDRLFDCNGQVWIFQAAARRAILGAPQRALQRKIDFLNYILPKNAQFAGFRERHFVGINQPRVKDAQGNDTNEPATPEFGPGVVSFWQPAFYEAQTNNGTEKRPAAAQLIVAEPVDSGPIRDDLEHMIRVLLKSCHLLHTIMSGDATSSAVSRIQSRAQFVRALHRLRPQVERVLRELFEVVLCLSCQLAGQGELLARFKKNYRIQVDCKVDAGPMTPQERAQIVAEYEKGILSLETARTMLGIEDVGAEANKVENEAAGALNTIERQASVIKLLTDAGASFEGSAQMVGFTPEEQPELFRTDIGVTEK